MSRRLLALLLVAGCSGEIGGPASSADSGPDPAPTPSGDPARDPTDPCAGVDAVGRCDGDGQIVRCVDRDLVVEPCTDDERCFDVAGAPVCQSGAEACTGIGPAGRCDGDRAIDCAAGWPGETDCALTGQVCGWADGYRCLDPATAPKRVAGVVEYEDRAVSPGMLAPPVPVPARGATVWLLRNADDSVVTTAVTADDGSFVLGHDEPDGSSLRVVAGSRNDTAARPLKVTRASGNVHGFRSADIDVTGADQVAILVTEASNAAQAFNIFDQLIYGMDETRRLGATSIAPLTAEWELGTSGGSYYQGGPNYMHIASGDGYDDVVVLHEFGHYHQDEYGASDSPGGPHPSRGGDDPRLAWGEGEATYLAIALRRSPYYIDYDSDGGWYVELEDRIHAADPSRSVTQYIYEWMVAQLMWDVGDDADDSDGDPVSGNHDDALRVTMDYLARGAGDRGASGVDLVDWLDGWRLATGDADCAALRELVRDWYGFPYDFAGPPGSCP